MDFDPNPPIFSSSRGAAVGCFTAFGTIVFLIIFIPLSIAFVREDGRWSAIYEVALPVAAIPAIVGTAVFSLFGFIAVQREQRVFQRFCEQFVSASDMTDSDFCQAIPDCDPTDALEYRHLLAKYLGIPPTRIHPHHTLNFPPGGWGEGVGLYYCLQHSSDSPPSIEQLIGYGWPERKLQLVEENARFFCHILALHNQSRSKSTE